jgi:hypothetical protein
MVAQFFTYGCGIFLLLETRFSNSNKSNCQIESGLPSSFASRHSIGRSRPKNVKLNYTDMKKLMIAFCFLVGTAVAVNAQDSTSTTTDSTSVSDDRSSQSQDQSSQ